MYAIWLENKDLYIRDDLSVPVPAHNEVLIRVLRAGICNTDLELMRGYYEFSGVIGLSLIHI